MALQRNGISRVSGVGYQVTGKNIDSNAPVTCYLSYLNSPVSSKGIRMEGDPAYTDPFSLYLNPEE